jgi:exodeoxyribonuclease-5
LTKQEFIGLLQENLGHAPTEGQMTLFRSLTEYLVNTGERDIFLVRGYAGTGKTTVVRALTASFPKTKLKTVLLAPTGRAAKVMSGYSGQTAYTIHKRIYFTQSSEFGMQFSLQRNLHRNTLFIVDEASMIGAENDATEHDLLSDLLEYVASGDQCRLMLIGDDAQLPPVGLDESPALSKQVLETKYFTHVTEVLLTEVVRQAADSGILWNATRIRDQLNTSVHTWPCLHTRKFPDVKRIGGMELEDHLQWAYDRYGKEDVLVITRSNKTAGLYNRQIRVRIHWQENEIAVGDLLMVVRNNYYWIPDDVPQEFIANGDTAEIVRLGKLQERGNYRFVDAVLRFTDYADTPELDVTLMLNVLDSEQASLNYAQYKELATRIEADYADYHLKAERLKKVKQDPLMNALQIKFAYAVTCHKAQGGQWKCVFVDQGYITEETIDRNYLRWLYTAITRATERVYLVNFNEAFFREDEEE